MADSAYLIRYGVMGYLGRFRAAPECPGPLDRGQAVVIRTDRGVELGEVLILLDEVGAARAVEQQRVIRPAGPDDLERSRRAEAARPDRFDLCRRVLEQEDWPWDLVDVEPLLDEGVTVLQYLGPHHLDVAAIRARFRMTCGLDIVLEPVGADLDEAAESLGGGCGSGGCGSDGGCGAGGGCGSTSPSGPENQAADCGSAAHAGCASCGLSRLAAARRPKPVAGLA